MNDRSQMKGRTANIILLIFSVFLVIFLFTGIFDIKNMLLVYAIIFGLLGLISRGFRGK